MSAAAAAVAAALTRDCGLYAHARDIFPDTHTHTHTARTFYSAEKQRKNAHIYVVAHTHHTALLPLSTLSSAGRHCGRKSTSSPSVRPSRPPPHPADSRQSGRGSRDRPSRQNSSRGVARQPERAAAQPRERERGDVARRRTCVLLSLSGSWPVASANVTADEHDRRLFVDGEARVFCYLMGMSDGMLFVQMFKRAWKKQKIAAMPLLPPNKQCIVYVTTTPNKNFITN